MTRLLCLLLAAGLGAGAVCVDPMPALLMNSDLLLPAAMMHNVLHDPGTATWFQFPRVPSLVPDLLLYLPLTWLLPDWRLAVPAYAALSLSALVWLGGMVVAQFGGGTAAAGTAAVLGLATAALAAGLLLDPGGAYPMILMPVIHSGPMLLVALAGLLLVRRAVFGGGSLWAVGLAGLLGTLSDRLFLAAFLAPVLANWFVGRRAADGPAVALRRTTAWAAGGCALGILVDLVLFHTVLFRQGITVPRPKQIGLIPAMLTDPHLLGTAALVGLVGALPLLWRGRTPDWRFWWVSALAASAACLVLTPLAYVDTSAVRYAQPTWWWAVLAAAAGLLRLRHLGVGVGMGVGVGVGVGLAMGAAGVLAVAWRAPPRWEAIARWHDPLADCLQRAREANLLHAGLAGYWTARVAIASSGWQLPMEQITTGGTRYVWGDNPWTATHAPGGGTPRTDYLVLQGLDPARLQRRFGPPDARLQCPGSEVWRWTDPGHLTRVLATQPPPEPD